MMIKVNRLHEKMREKDRRGHSPAQYLLPSSPLLLLLLMLLLLMILMRLPLQWLIDSSVSSEDEDESWRTGLPQHWI
jgi:hypothetical protein